METRNQIEENHAIQVALSNKRQMAQTLDSPHGILTRQAAGQCFYFLDARLENLTRDGLNGVFSNGLHSKVRYY